MVAHRLGISHTQVVAHGFVLALGGVAPLAHHLLDLHDVGPLLLRDHRINLSEDGDANCAQERHTGTRENDSQASQAYFSEPAALSSSLSCALPPQPFRGSLSSLHWPAAGRRMCGGAPSHSVGSPLGGRSATASSEAQSTSTEAVLMWSIPVRCRWVFGVLGSSATSAQRESHEGQRR